MRDKIKVLIVDDSAVIRQRLSSALSHHAKIEVIGTAKNGKDAVQKAVMLRPDVITMDIHMPEMDGLTALQYIMELAPCPIIILSAFSKKGAIVTFEAMELGAFDFVAKPDGYGEGNIQTVIDDLTQRILAASQASGFSVNQRQRTHVIPSHPEIAYQPGYEKIVVIGVSTGGPRTVMDILPHFPENFPAPILLIQHMPALFTTSFAERLNRNLPMRVVEASHRMLIEPGTIFIAPGGHHMLVEKALGKENLRVSVRSHVANKIYKPSIDLTMLSLLENVPAEKIVSVLLTGIGDDGAEGMVQIRHKGGFTIAEAEETAVVYGMPRAAAERGGARVVLPSYQIGQAIMKEVL